MAWFLMMVAILFEVSGTTSMKLADGFTKLVPSILIFVFYGLSFVALTFALKKIDLSIAYAVWSGVGTAIVALIGIVWFGEAVTALRVVSLVMIIAGVIGLHAAS